MDSKSTAASSFSSVNSAEWNSDWETPDDGIPKSHYIDPDYAALEAEKLWPHVWQMACREEEVARPGDYTVYEIVDQSILIIRTDENTIKAYHNVCPHRATALAQGSGRFSTGEITCPFHGWRWNLEGENTFVLDRDEFKGGCLSDEDVHLRECQVATWIGCVFINMDADAPSFEDHIAPIRSIIDPLLVDQMKFYWWKSLEVPANWKVAQEAFHEAYHVPQTHPQLYRERSQGPSAGYTQNYSYEVFENGHANFWFSNVTSDRYMRRNNVDATLTNDDQIEALISGLELAETGMDAMTLKEEVYLAHSMRHREIPEGSTPGAVFMQLVHEHYAARGRAIAKPEDIARCSDAFIFPNYTFLVSYGNVLIYRARPTPDNDPDRCIFELWSCRTYGTGETPPRPQCEHMTDGADTDQYRLIPRQDFSNIPRMQKGLHSHAFQKSMISGRQEIALTNAHKEIDSYLKA